MEASPDEVRSEGTLTILFTDLEGSTDLRTRVGDDVANALIHAHERLIRSQLAESGGVESKALGDGFMILFPGARQAIKTAVAIQRTIEEHNRDNPDQPIKVRMGLNTGDVTQHGSDAYGTAVHAAARIAGKANGGQILMAQIVHDLAGMQPDLRVVDRGMFWLKGFPSRWRLYEVLWRDKWEGSERSQARAAAATAPQDLDLVLPRARGPVVGRVTELGAIRQHLEDLPRGGIRALVLEGEAGIGKTRLLEATAEMAREADPPCWALDVAADEELRGPFLLFRTLMGAPRLDALAEQAMAGEPLELARNALSGRQTSRSEGLSAQEQMLRVFDEVCTAVAALARERPLALLLDDLQWADEDSIRLIRYLVRTLPSMPLFFLISMRPYAEGTAEGARNLIADLDRMHLAQRLRLQRFTRSETAQLLTNLLDAPVSDETLDSLHARAEGVPFFIEEFARAYREAKALQLIDGTWTMIRLSGPAVPASVHSLIARRLAQVSEEAHGLLTDAAVLGRRFRLADLSKVRAVVEGGEAVSEWRLHDTLGSAQALGILTALPEESGFDFSFSHDQIRAALADAGARHRRRAVHGAIVELLAAEESPENLSTLAYHALQAGDDKRAVSCAIRAARASLEAHAPEEGIRIIDTSLASATVTEDRISMLRLKDDALALLERGQERMANLAELGALTSALGDPATEWEVKLRRSSAARMAGDFEAAAALARSVREAAAAADDARTELEACLELGQALTRCPIGEGFWPLVEVDLDAAEEPFQRALELARRLEDRSIEAAALRELAVVAAGRARLTVMAEAAAGKDEAELMAAAPTFLAPAKELADQAFQIYEELGDRRGAMSALISVAYAHVADPTPRGMAGRLEQVRRLRHGRQRLTSEAQAGRDDAMMAYSIQLFAHANVQPDLALERGHEAYESARAIGDRWLEALAAGGVAMTLVSLGRTGEAEGWVDRASSAARADPRPGLVRRLEMWRGLLAGAGGDAGGLIEHLERAAELGAEHSSPAGRCEALAHLAMETAKLGLATGDDALLERSEQAVGEVRALLSTLTGRMPWEAMAHAASALVALARQQPDRAADEGRSALEILEPRFNRTHYLDVLWAAGRALIPSGAPEAADLAKEILEDLTFIDLTTADPEVMADWFSMGVHRELAELAGYQPMDPSAKQAAPDGLEEDEVELLRLLTAGSGDPEIASRLGRPEVEVSERVEALLNKLGVESREGATQFALKAGIT